MKILLLFVLSIFISFQNISLCQDLSPELIYEKVNDCVVVILSYDFNGKLAKQGSGVVISDKGWIVTNYHVFAECEKMEVKHNEKIIKYSDIIGVDVEKDILILKIEENTFPSISIGSSDNLKVGQRIYAIGSPLGLENSLSEGIISGLRNVDEKNRNYIQITAGISLGSSGGAVVNSRGELIGVSTSSLQGGQNLNFAIPINEIMVVTLGSYSDKESIEAVNYFYKGDNAENNGKYIEAINYYTKYLDVFPYDEKGYINRGNAYHLLRFYNKAILDYTKAIELNPQIVAAYSNRGMSFKNLGDYTKAFSDFNEAIELNPNFATGYFNRGTAYYEIENYPFAISDFNKSIEINPSDASIYVNREIAFFKSGNMNQACKDWNKAYTLGFTKVKEMLDEFCR